MSWNLILASGFIILGTVMIPAASTDRSKKPELRLDVEVERGGPLDRLTVYICNDTGEPFSFLTGSRGGGGSLDDRPTKVPTGTAPTVIPELVFQWNEGGKITLRPPAIGGPTRRAMEPEKLEIPSGARTAYASFQAPHDQVRGKLIWAKLRLTDGRELVGNTLVEGRAPGK